MPSSASRSSASSLLGAPDRDRVVHQRDVERLGGAAEAAELGEHVLAGATAELGRVPRREPELVEALDVLRLGDARSAAAGRRTRTGSRRRARARAAGSACAASTSTPSTARSTSGRWNCSARLRAMPSELAKPSSSSARENEPPARACAPPRACRAAAGRCRRRPARRARCGPPSVARDAGDDASSATARRRERPPSTARVTRVRHGPECCVARQATSLPPSTSTPGTRRGSGSPAKSATTPPSARNGPNGIFIFRAARPWRASRTTDGNERGDHARSSSRPARCARA